MDERGKWIFCLIVGGTYFGLYWGLLWYLGAF